MKNIWTQHLERSADNDRSRNTTFPGMLHSLVKNSVEADATAGTTLFLPDDVSCKEIPYPVRDNAGNEALTEETTPVLNDDGVDVSYAAETELAVWTAKSQKGYELGLTSCDEDSVKLLMSEGGRLFLRYDVAGESPFEMNVRSEEEAEQIIEEDNSTTEQLYPSEPELKWIKIN
ncbi:hypothetical protein [Methanolobus sp. WCC4]|uniref:hypothetical protein n=1 Tax=Methanolobus sp. WCC4 TaxID=3125784 RepID=UPI0030F942AC